jgi:hypothetical protein
MGKEALVIIHLSSLDSYTQQGVESGNWGLGDDLANGIIDAILNHKGPVYIVDQGWSLGPRESRPRARVIESIEGRPVQWIQFDEDKESWDRFEKEMTRILRRDGVTKVVLGGLWWQSDLEGGCVTETYLRLRKNFKVKVNEGLVGCESDFDDSQDE